MLLQNIIFNRFQCYLVPKIRRKEKYLRTLSISTNFYQFLLLDFVRHRRIPSTFRVRAFVVNPLLCIRSIAQRGHRVSVYKPFCRNIASTLKHSYHTPYKSLLLRPTLSCMFCQALMRFAFRSGLVSALLHQLYQVKGRTLNFSEW